MTSQSYAFSARSFDFSFSPFNWEQIKLPSLLLSLTLSFFSSLLIVLLCHRILHLAACLSFPSITNCSGLCYASARNRGSGSVWRALRRTGESRNKSLDRQTLPNIMFLRVFLFLSLVIFFKGDAFRIRRHPKRRHIDTDRYDSNSFFSSHEIGDVFKRSGRDQHPIPLNEEQLAWMTDRERDAVQRLRDSGATRWDVMNKIGSLFYSARSEVRQKSLESLRSYCLENIEKLIGEENVQLLKGMHADSATVEKIETKFHELVGQMPIEGDRMKAEHYGQFCRKIFRLVHFEPTDLTSWLTGSQKFQIGEMIQDSSIGDDKVYQQVFDFFNATTGAQREDAQEIIDNGCRWFIDHMFGDDVAEEIEEHRYEQNVTKQQLAARLAILTTQIHSETHRKHAINSLPICTRIYIGYDFSCNCNGRSDTCDDTHQCTNCTGNTYGVQCEKCIESYELDISTGNCVHVEEHQEETTKCLCNGHSTSCDGDGKCLNCEFHTTGDQCEMCDHGFYGDAHVGSSDDCTPCPCPNEGACEVNSIGLVQCLECPVGTRGMHCEIMDSPPTTNHSSPSEVEKVEKSEESLTGY